MVGEVLIFEFYEPIPCLVFMAIVNPHYLNELAQCESSRSSPLLHDGLGSQEKRIGLVEYKVRR